MFCEFFCGCDGYNVDADALAKKYKSSTVAEMGDRNKHGPKSGRGCCAPFHGRSWVSI